MQCDPNFLSLLVGFESLEGEHETVFGLWPDLRLAYVNPAWFRFARENEGEPAISRDWTLGRCILDAVAEPLRPFFVGNYSRCLEINRPWEHVYECSSDEKYREFHMTVFPLERAQGLLVVNSLRIETTPHREAKAAVQRDYRSDDGLILQCCHCRRVRRRTDPGGWDWVPEWVRQCPPKTSHGICEPCFAYYYSDPGEDDFPEPWSTIVT